jgi:predicted phosphohydrolase
MRKHEIFFKENGIDTISFLYNNAYEIEDTVIAGTRGWYHDEDAAGAPDNADFKKLVNRESLRLRMSLDKARELSLASGKPIAVFMHFPPYWNGKESENLIALLKEFNITKVFYGHIHGNYTLPQSYTYDGIEMSIVSADYLKFIPKIVK